ncbi:helix-turn-helix domain-containing protein [Petrotoga sp. 9PW.55.5.1]|uniref:helix-turn-helix domain-containing protein n=1 Tax=Petrotoga sp. 9PW.55.5.1 TaxID=1308979 RepID=UPI000DD8E14E|nr:helix-turn-helix transcriptional regulator [Petrotoga sp. 9PW.55.5.1]
MNEKENKWEEIDKSSLLDFVYEIKKRRLQLGITQKSLAQKMGTTQAIISKFEKGNYNPTFMFLQRLAEVLGGKIKLYLEVVNDEKIKKDSNFNNEDNFEEIFHLKLEE